MPARVTVRWRLQSSCELASMGEMMRRLRARESKRKVLTLTQVTLVALLLVVCAGAFRWSERHPRAGGDQGLRREQRRVPSSGAERRGDPRAGRDRAPGGRGNQEPSKRRREHAPERHPPAGLLRDSSPQRKDSARPARDGIDGDAGNRVHVKGSEHSTRSSHQQERPSQSHSLLTQRSDSTGTSRTPRRSTRRLKRRKNTWISSS